MKIANPIYDVVFKYLMNDNKIAMLMLSTILDKKIVSLEFSSTEEDDEKLRGIALYRLDFAALIENEDGEKEKVLIEIQKAKNAEDIMRFRRYLGNQYKDNNNSFKEREGNRLVKKAIPLITIYFLGYKFNNITSPLIKVSRDYIDISTSEKINKKEEFIESLTHDSYIIQIPYLKGKRRTELEQLLSVFDQDLISKENDQEIIINENYPEKFRIVISKLLKAFSEPKVRNRMDREDEIIEKFDDYELIITEKETKLKEAKQKEQEAKQKLINSAKQMQKDGMTTELIIKYTGLTKQEIEQLE